MESPSCSKKEHTGKFREASTSSVERQVCAIHYFGASNADSQPTIRKTISFLVLTAGKFCL